MRTLERLLVLLLIVPVVCLFTSRAAAAKLFFLSLGAILIVVAFHFVREGPHWQLIPLYACVPCLVLAFLYRQELTAVVCRWCAAGCCLLILCAVGFSYVLPMFRLPAPTGNYEVGTRLLYLVDKSREETHAQAPKGKRELMVQLWYPARCACGPLASYRRRAETTLLSSYMSVLKTHSHQDAPIADTAGLFPVLLFNPAWKNSRTQNTFQFEDLASHGFVIASIDHTYNSQPVSFPDGRRIVVPDLKEIGDFQRLTWDQVTELGNSEVEIQATDDIFVLNSLAELNRNSTSDFFQRLNTDDAGAFGHSFGGAVAMEACRRDPRIKAALNMDGWLFGVVADSGLDKPLFVMSDDTPEPSAADLQSAHDPRRLGAKWDQRDIQRISFTLEKFGGYFLLIKGGLHMIFSDRALYSPIRRLGESGGANCEAAHRLIEDYTLAFFAKYLTKKNLSLLTTVPSSSPGAEFKVYPRKLD
jgi:pimeloyl-ACP methyl ester carboxylesterase